jgi:ferredoxin like protein
MSSKSIAERLATNKYVLDDGHPHISVDNEICRTNCVNKECLFVCPANVYTEKDGEIVVDWAGCLECATCKAACVNGGLTWNFPRGGFGIVYRQG